MAFETGIPDDETIFPLLAELSACLCAELGEDRVPCFCGILVGDQTPAEYVGTDDCDACGAAYVRLVDAYPSTMAFPAPDEDSSSSCMSAIAYTVAVGVLRCSPTLDERGDLPEPSDLYDFSRALLADMTAMRRAIRCCLASKFEDNAHSLVRYTPLVDAGGVAGGEWTLIIQEAI